MVLLLLPPKEEIYLHVQKLFLTPDGVKSIFSLCNQRETESFNRAELAPTIKVLQPVCV